jgi:hypothetical protein
LAADEFFALLSTNEQTAWNGSKFFGGNERRG